MLVVNFLDIGSLDCGEVLSLFGSPLSAIDVAQEEARVAARRLRYGAASSYHVGQAVYFHRQLSRPQRVIPRLLQEGAIALNLFLIDPQLQDAKTAALRELAGKLPNLAVYPLRAAVNDQPGFSFAKLYLTRSGDPLGSSLFAGKHNVDAGRFDRVPCMNLVELVRSIEEECAVCRGACNILRINAEGVEFALLKSMEAAGYLRHFRLFMGSGHDLRKVDKVLYAQYLQFLDEHGISFVEFKASDRKQAVQAVRLVEQRITELLGGSSQPARH
jgi:hypothetical protein